MRSIFVGVALCASVSFAGDILPAPKSPAAAQAIKRADAAIGKAEQAYRTAKLAALRQLVSDLRAAMPTATKAGNLDEANAIKGALDRADLELTLLAGVSFTVRADEDWQRATNVLAGAPVKLRASGQWWASRARRDEYTCGPDGRPDPGTKEVRFYLEGRIGDGEPFKIGSSYSMTPDTGGMLYLRMADTGFQDNGGSLKVVVQQ
jgi:hypothetical protein